MNISRHTSLSFLMAAMIVIAGACGSKLESQGDSLAAAKTAGQGKTHMLTLQQINIEIDRDGLYIRVFGQGTPVTGFLYFDADLKNKVANLKRNTKYIYKFTTTDTQYTFKGKLLDVAETETGKSVSGSLIDNSASAKQIRLAGKEAAGQTFTVPLKFTGIRKSGEEDFAWFSSTDDYRFSIQGSFAEAMKTEIEGLDKDKVNQVKLKVTENGISIKAEILEVK